MDRKRQTYGPHPEEEQGAWPYRATTRGTRHGVASGHPLGALAAFEILEAGGNAIDAGVAAGLVEAVVQPDQVGIAGVAPIMIFDAANGSVATISGLGTWPAKVDSRLFVDHHGGRIPEGLLRTVVPAAPSAWLVALDLCGTMSFADVAASAIRFAGEGFPIHAFTAAEIRKRADYYRRWPENAAVFLPGDAPPQPGDLFVQRDLATTLQYMVDEEASGASRGRAAGLQAAHDAFYRGDIAARIVAYHRDNGGLLEATDMAAFRAPVEPPVNSHYKGLDVHTCGFWSQGPVLLQALNILADIPLQSLEHNSAGYIHHVVEALKLAFADRHAYYGDPDFIDVPAAALLSPEYAATRRALIDVDKACPEMPPPGDPYSSGRTAASLVDPEPTDQLLEPVPDTSIVCIKDRWGNVFAASPSDPSYNMEMIPGTGLCPSSRGSQSWADPNHPSSVAPGKRPRLTPMPAMALRDGTPEIVLGTPGGDVQPQAMLQVLLNLIEFGMDVQVAVEAPRFVSRSMPDSFEPHHYFPGQLNLEGKYPADVGEALATLGHDVNWWPTTTSRAGGVCALQIDSGRNVFYAGADFRRCGFAIGW